MREISKERKVLLEALLDADSVFMVSFRQALPDENGQLSIPEIKTLSYKLPAGHFTTVQRAVTTYIGSRMDFILVDYLRLIQQQKEEDDEADISH